MIKRILYIFNLLFVLLLLGVYVGMRVSPEFIPELSLFSYIYPLLLVVNVLFCLFWLFFKRKYIFVPLAVILIGSSYTPRFIGFNFQASNQEQEKTLSIMTFNVGHFQYNAQEDKKIAIANKDSILSLIKTMSPDVVCLQEYASVKKSKTCFHYIMTEVLGYEHFFAPDNSSNYVRGSVIYSKHSISRSGTLFPLKKNYYSKTYADVVVEKQTLRIYNVHLDSYRLSEQEKTEVNKIKDAEMISEETSKSILDKLLETNKEQAKEVRELKSILDQTMEEYLLVGDFNATPYSYTYQVLQKDLKDSFVEKASGFSGTYNDLLPKFRIDYIFASQSIDFLSYEQNVYNYSDHNPVFARFKLK